MKAIVKKCGGSLHVVFGRNKNISVGDEIHILTEDEYQTLTAGQATPAATPEEPILDIAKTMPSGTPTPAFINWLEKTWLFSPAYLQRTKALALLTIEDYISKR
jgi:hypothetical protein